MVQCGAGYADFNPVPAVDLAGCSDFAYSTNSVPEYAGWYLSSPKDSGSFNPYRTALGDCGPAIRDSATIKSAVDFNDKTDVRN